MTQPSRTPANPIRRLLRVSLAACLLALQASDAFAHAHYDHSQPAIGQVLAIAPAQVDLYTDSEMRKVAGSNVIMVTAQDGSQADDGNTVVDDNDRKHFWVALLPSLPGGRYVVSFQTLSDADGDTDRGRFSFYVGSGPTTEQRQLDAEINGVAPVPAVAQAPAATGHASLVAMVLALGIAMAVIGLVLVRRWKQQT